MEDTQIKTVKVTQDQVGSHASPQDALSVLESDMTRYKEQFDEAVKLMYHEDRFYKKTEHYEDALFFISGVRNTHRKAWDLILDNIWQDNSHCVDGTVEEEINEMKETADEACRMLNEVWDEHERMIREIYAQQTEGVTASTPSPDETAHTDTSHQESLGPDGTDVI